MAKHPVNVNTSEFSEFCHAENNLWTKLQKIFLSLTFQGRYIITLTNDGGVSYFIQVAARFGAAT